MSSRQDNSLPDGVDRLREANRETVVSDELGRLMTILRDSLPAEAVISFLYDGKLGVRVDVRTIEQVMAVEMILPTLAGGIFHGIQRGKAPNHSFLHRISALVDR